MENISILIVEDDAAEAKRLCAVLQQRNYHIAGVANNLQMATDLFHQQQPDIAVIDIMLNGREEGIVFAARINEDPARKCPFVFLTGLTDRTAFDNARLTAPFAYLIKPFNELELQYSLELALEKFAGETGVFSSGRGVITPLHDHFFVKKGNAIVKVPVGDILFISVDGKYSSIVTSTSRFLVLHSLTELLEMLPHKRFVRVHRNTVVQVAHIRELHVQDNYVLLNDGHLVNMSRRYKEWLIQALAPLK